MFWLAFCAGTRGNEKPWRFVVHFLGPENGLQQVMLHSEMVRYDEYVEWVCLMGLVIPQTVLCQAELMELWTLVCKQSLVIPVRCEGAIACAVFRNQKWARS